MTSTADMAQPAAAERAGSISTRISFLDRDAAWKAFEISLPFGASDADIAYAIDQVERQKVALMTRFHYQGATFNPAEILLNFGKHTGKTVGWVVRNDRRYVDEYLLRLPDLDAVWRAAFTETIEALNDGQGASFTMSDMPL